jgi:hypothetical protein
MTGQASAIRAGRAFVELFADDAQLRKGLKGAADRLKAFGGVVRNIGLAFTALGVGITAPLMAAARGWAKAGDELYDMSKRTGLSVEQLSALSYAAAHTGADLTSVEVAVRRMQTGPGGLYGGAPASLVVIAKNSTGSALSAGGVATVAAAVPPAPAPAAFLETPMFTLALTTAAGPPAIAAEPIAFGASGRVVVAGLAVCQLQVLSTSHLYAATIASDLTKLASAESGPARILHRNGTTGTVAAAVLLGAGGGGSAAASAEVAKVVTLGSGYSYTVRPQDWNAQTSAFVDRPGAADVTARNIAEIGVGPGQMVDVGTYVVLHTMGSIYVFSHPVFAKYKD